MLAGAGRYTDPWHDHQANAAAVADFLTERGYLAEVRADVDQALAELQTPSRFGLLAVCVGEAEAASGPAPAPAAAAGLEAWFDQGRSLLAVHDATLAFADWPGWERQLGARWIWGETYHPPIGPGLVRIDPRAEAGLGRGLADFSLVDEFYTNFRLADWVRPVAFHRPDSDGPAGARGAAGADQPLAWVRRTANARLAYCALGHDSASYQSPGHRALLGRLLDWLEQG
ncbi:MAG: ThuA domain-containing protein [Bifidobacteriaceae bacterium]|nr:ThuA domain-containing protein [Bifidobacteriaceae bacterium]